MQGGYQQQSQATGYDNMDQAKGSPVTGYAPAQDFNATSASGGGKQVPVIGEPFYADCSDPELNQHFRVDGYKDVWAMILFYLALIACIVIAGVNGKKLHVDTSNDGVNTDSTSLFVRACGAGFGFAILITAVLLALVVKFPTAFIWIANLLIVAIFVAYTIMGIVWNLTGLIIIGIFFTLLTALWLWCIRGRIPFSALLLKTGADRVATYWGTLVVGFLGVIFIIVYFVPWTYMSYPTIHDMQNGNGNGGSTWVFLLFLLMLFWFQQVCANVSAVTTGGSFGTWYFIGDREAPSSPTIASFKRAMTTSFGSICFGSLIVAILKTIEAVARSMYSQNRNSALACIAYCLISCIERLMRWFNDFAYAQISLIGCSYIEGAKKTFELMFEKGCIWTAIINDILIDRVFLLCTILALLANGALCYAVYSYSWIAALAGALMGLIVCSTVFRVVHSSVVTFLVCVAEYPDVLAAKHPQLNGELTVAIQEMQKGCC